MKKQMIKISSLLFVMVAMMLSACDDYLDDVPKGRRFRRHGKTIMLLSEIIFPTIFLIPTRLQY